MQKWMTEIGVKTAEPTLPESCQCRICIRCLDWSRVNWESQAVWWRCLRTSPPLPEFIAQHGVPEDVMVRPVWCWKSGDVHQIPYKPPLIPLVGHRGSRSELFLQQCLWSVVSLCSLYYDVTKTKSGPSCWQIGIGKVIAPGTEFFPATNLQGSLAKQ